MKLKSEIIFIVIMQIIGCFMLDSCYRNVGKEAHEFRSRLSASQIYNNELCANYGNLKYRKANYLFGSEKYKTYMADENPDEALIGNCYNRLLLNGEYTYRFNWDDPIKEAGIAAYRNYYYGKYMYEFIGDILAQTDCEEKIRLNQLKEQNKGLNDADDEAPKTCIESDGRCYDPKDLCMGVHEDESGYAVSYKISSRLKLYGDEYGAWDDSGVYAIDDAAADDSDEGTNSKRINQRVVKYDHAGNPIWKSNPISADPEIPTSILGVDRNHVYVLTFRGEILAFDVESGKAVWKNPANIKMDIELSESGRRYKFKSSEETGTFSLHYPTETSQASEVYDASDGRLVFGVHAEVLRYETDAEYLYYSHGDEIRRIAIGSVGGGSRSRSLRFAR